MFSIQMFLHTTNSQAGPAAAVFVGDGTTSCRIICCCCVSAGFLSGKFLWLIFTLNPPLSRFPGLAKPLGYGKADDVLQ